MIRQSRSQQLLRAPQRVRKATRRDGASRAVMLTPWQPMLRKCMRLVGVGGAGFLVLAGLLLAAPMVRNGLDQPIREVRILTDLFHQDPEAIRVVIAKHRLDRFSAVPLDSIRAGLEELPWIQQVHVRRVWPDSLQVRVREQIPTARWGEGRLLNEHGQTFAAEQTDSFSQLPLLQGPEASTQTVLEMHQRIAPLLAAENLRVRALHLSQRGAWDLTLDNGVLVRLGRGEAVARTARFLEFYRRQLVGRIHTVAVVDTRYSNGIAVTWAPGQVIEETNERQAG